MTLRRLRSRFGIANRRLAIRTHIPWYWRAALTVVMLAAALALAGWMFDLGRSLAGFQHSESEQKLTELETELSQARGEVDRLTALSAGTDSSLQIERTVQQKLSAQVKQLESENGRLREELATMENMVAGGRQASGPAVTRLSVEPQGNGMYRVSAMLLASGDVDGSVQLRVSILQGGKTDMLSFPAGAAQESDRFRARFHKMLRFESSFQVAPDAKVSDVELNLLVKGISLAARKIAL